MASRVFYFICNWAVKHSLLLFYATLTVDHYPRLSIYAMHALAIAFGVSCVFITIFQCTPINKMWRGAGDSRAARAPEHCIDINAFNYFNSCFMFANDLILYAMPLIFTWRLNVSRSQRIAVNFLFALGGLVLAASGARIFFVHKQATHADFTYRFAMTMICAVIENHLAIIVACAPSIKVILLHIFPGLEQKFEKLVSKGSTEHSSPSIGTIAIDAETGMLCPGKVFGDVRPRSSRSTTGESGKIRGRDPRKWWQPPSNWEVNRVSKEECPLEKLGRLENTASLQR
jgi:hypothetical protein